MHNRMSFSKILFCCVVALAFFSFRAGWTPSVALAGRTCCESPGNDPSKCNGCDNNIYWKNAGDNCGGDPNCRTCPGDHPVGNACGGTTPPAGDCRYASFVPKTITLQQGKSLTVTFGFFATTPDNKPIVGIRFTSANAKVATVFTTHVRSFLRNVCCSWKYGHFATTMQINGELPGSTTVLGEVINDNGTCAAANLVVKVVPPPNPPTPPPGCSCGEWTKGECNAGGCPNGSYPQTRSCDPALCAAELQCVSDPTCYIPPTPPPPLVNITSKIETDPSLTGGTAPQLIGLTDQYCNSPSVGKAFSAGTIAASKDGGTTYPYAGTVAASGAYTITKLPKANDAYCVKFTPSSPNIICTCPAGCVYCGKDAPSTNLKFYVSPIGSPWYQTIGGEIGAQNTTGKAVSNPIPATCLEPGCLPYLSLPFVNDLRTVGALITHKGGSVDLSEASGNQSTVVSPGGSSRKAQLSTALVCRENYDYFFRLYSMGLAPTGDFAYPLDARKPTAPPSGGKSAYFYKGGTLTISQPWDLTANDSIVVFVNGNLNIKSTITVPKPVGATKPFLAFIVSGNISVDSTVGTTDHASTTPGQVQGIYIASGSINVLGNTSGGEDKKFIGEGTFSACTGIKIDRDFSRGGVGLDNNKYPASMFVYRPDFMQSTPDRMKTSSFVWKEITP